jgi:hypothetical protein
MKIIVSFYTNKKFRNNSQNLIKHYESRGFRDVRHFKSEDVKSGSFYDDNKEILDCETGDGFWLWKPKIILDIFNELNNGDSIMYTDAGDLVDVDYNTISHFLTTNDYYFTNWGGVRWPQKICTKRDCFILMDCDEEKYHNTSQMEAGFLIIKKTNETVKFLNDYYHYSSIKEIIDNEPSKYGKEFDGWRFHRNDQSILTNLIVKYGFNFNNQLDTKIKYNIYQP